MPGRSFVGANGYWYGFNGKEKDDEVKGNGNSYDFDARIYDPRIGRWLSTDPQAAKYPFFSPYTAFANNPIYYIDPSGETLKVAATDPAVLEDYKSLVSCAFADKVYAQINEGGIVTFHQVPNTKLTEYETEAFNSLNAVATSKYTANINLVSNDEDVSTGAYYENTLDVADVQSFGNDENKYTSRSILVHETVEQLDKAVFEELEGKKITKASDGPQEYHYNASHQTASMEENKTSNIQRSGLEKSYGEGINPMHIITEMKAKIEGGGFKDVKVTTTYNNNNKPTQTVEDIK